MLELFKFYSNQGFVALDTETTGLRPYHGDISFGISIAAPGVAHYFPMTSELISCLRYFFANFNGYLFYHNAKFDMTFFKQLDCDVFRPNTFCTLSLGRLVNSDLLKYSLDSLAKTIGYEKDDGVKKYCEEHKLFVMEQRGKKRKKKIFFDKVPLEVMEPYAKKDAEITLQLGNHQLKTLAPRNEFHVAKNEARLTKTFFRMEQVGVKIDRPYIESALTTQQISLKSTDVQFMSLTGTPFKDHAPTLHKAFLALESPTKVFTEKGSPSYDKHALAAIDHPLARLIEEYRETHSRVATFENLLYFADHNDILHANVRQAGCATGRVSYTDPPMQCMEKNEESAENLQNIEFYPIRASFTPRKDYFFVMMDYDQFEYRMMLNYAKEMKLIDAVKSGLDVHTATAEQVRISRKHAKTMNFMLLYGGGPQKLADALKIPFNEAKYLRHKYFENLPNVYRFIEDLKNQVNRFQELQNWFGRRYKIPREHSYKAPNYCIQGGTADWVKIAMNNIDEFLLPMKSRMLLQVHDELLFEIHESEEHIIPELKSLMENVTDTTPHNILKYTVGIEYSDKNWHLKQEWKSGCKVTKKKIG